MEKHVQESVGKVWPEYLAQACHHFICRNSEIVCLKKVRQQYGSLISVSVNPQKSLSTYKLVANERAVVNPC